MIQIQGSNNNTKMRHAMRSLRAAYLDNVRHKRCAMDKEVLAKFDATLKEFDDQAKAHSRQR